MTRFVPDGARKVVELERKIDELARLVRSNADHSHNMRDLKDGNLFDAQDGQVPVYKKAIGEFRPGAGGAVGLLTAEGSTATQTLSSFGDPVAFDTVTLDAGSHGITPEGTPGAWVLPVGGFYVVTASLVFDTVSLPGDLRELQINSWGVTGAATADNVPRIRGPIVESGSSDYLTVTLPCYAQTAPASVWVEANNTSNGVVLLLGPYSFLSILRVG